MSKNENQGSKEASRSWFCVLNNPQSVFTDLENPEDIVQAVIDRWCKDKPYRTCAVNYEIGDTGNHHLHMVLEDPSKSRFSAVQKLFPGVHIEPTRGNKEQAEDYILKRGRFAEKNHTVIVPAQFKGQIKANQGKRNDLDTIKELIEQGLTPNEIMDLNIHFRVHESLIRKEYYRKRSKETQPIRDVKVTWRCGPARSGKSYKYVKLCEEYGEDSVYLLTDYDKGGFDMYNGEPILFMDEFKGNLKFQLLLNYLDGYKVQIPCRYQNVYALWNQVYITSVFPPEELYKKMVSENREIDTFKQLLGRIDTMIYCWRDESGYHEFELPSSEYIDYEDLKHKALGPDVSDFVKWDGQETLPFD